jgi:hypothetical protein
MSVIIGVGPHKATHTAVAIDRDEQPIAKLQVVADQCLTERLLAWAASFGFERTWAIESANGWASCWRSSWLAPASTWWMSQRRCRRGSGC